MVAIARNPEFGTASVARRVASAMRCLPSAQRYLIAFSGGPDSSALLHAMRWRRSVSGREASISAVHVHHGLHARADDWATHCVATCESLGVALQILRVDARPTSRESPEEAARRARYAALEPLVERGVALCTAHHLDDQAETVLLQLLRGAGPHGLAAMPVTRTFGAGLLVRPFLALERRVLRVYLEGAGVRWVDDDSNRDQGLDRGYLRAEVLPALAARWPCFATTLGRAAIHQAESVESINSVAGADFADAAVQDDGLSVEFVVALSASRRHALLRRWLRRLGLPTPTTAQLRQIDITMLDSRADAAPVVRWSGAEVRRYRGVLFALRPMVRSDRGTELPWEPPATLELGDGSHLLAQWVVGSGLSAAQCHGGSLEVRFRQGGERCRPVGRGGRRTLKNLFQEHAVPPWLRARVPLLYRGDELAAVANICVCEGFAAPADEPGWVPRWRPARVVSRCDRAANSLLSDCLGS